MTDLAQTISTLEALAANARHIGSWRTFHPVNRNYDCAIIASSYDPIQIGDIKNMQDADFIVAVVKALPQLLEAAKQVDKLTKLSVANLLVNIIPDEDGIGREVYAKSVDEVELLLGKISETDGLKAQLAARVTVKLPAYRYLKDRSKGDETFSVYSEGYDNALDHVAEILRAAGIEIAE